MLCLWFPGWAQSSSVSSPELENTAKIYLADVWLVALLIALISATLFVVIVLWNRRLAAEITERKVAERELRKLSRVVEQSPAAVLITDPRGRIEYVNPAFSAVTGYAIEEVLGRTPSLLNSGRQDAATYRALWDRIRAGEVWRGELANKRKNGDIFWEHAAIGPIFDENGQITHFCAIKEDITARKQAEAELIQAKEAAEAADRAKGEFLANMRHEIRTPMNALLGMVHLTLATELTPKQRDYLTKTDAAARALLRLLEDILDYSRIETGQVQLEQTRFRLDRVLQQVQQLLQVQSQAKGLALHLELAPEVPLALVGDPLRLTQVLLHLGGNAVKFTERGTVQIRVDLATAPCLLKFSISDTGIGLSEPLQAKLFERFSQADLGTHHNARLTALETGFRLSLPGKVVIRKPDLGLVRDSNAVPLQDLDRSYRGTFDLCVEALSDSTPAEIARDTEQKRAEYEAVGVPEYYILHHQLRWQLFYRRNAFGVYEPMARDDGIMRSAVVPGFRFRLADLLTRPAPEALIEDPVYAPFVLPRWQQDRAARRQAEERAEQAEQLARRKEAENAALLEELARLRGGSRG